MKRLFPISFLLSALFVAAPLAAQDVDVSGDWDLTVETLQGPQVIPVKLVQDGTSVEGTALFMGSPFTVSNGVLEEDKLTFAISMEANGSSISINVVGIVEGDEVTGTVSMLNGEQTTFSAKRREGV